MCHVLILEMYIKWIDKIVLDICNNNLEVPITLNELGRTHPIGKVRGGKVQVIAQFITYRQRQAVYSSKSKYNNNPKTMFITENLTTRRRETMDELNYVHINRKVSACWSMDGDCLLLVWKVTMSLWLKALMIYGTF
jgi:hypothetical protein